MKYKQNFATIREGHGSFLFLQGPPSGFYKQVGKYLKESGQEVYKINFCLGDQLYWRGKDVTNFRGKKEDWEDFLRQFIEEHQITDVIYYADRLPYHKMAGKVARQMGVRDISVEFGYLRPDWILLERGGQSIYSHFPNKLKKIKKIANNLPTIDMEKKYGFSFAAEAWNEVVFNLSNYFGFFAFKNYSPDKYYNPVIEYLSYLKRLASGTIGVQKARKQVIDLIKSNSPYFVCPLQMQNDYQIRDNSPQTNLPVLVDEIICSFSKNAFSEDQLVFKIHPLDNGLINWKKVINKSSKQHGVVNRIQLIDGGNMHALMRASKGVIVVNSTTGLQALELNVPLKVLGVAVYDIKGLSDQKPLAKFWENPQKAKQSDVRDLVKVLAHSIHIRGDFYSTEGQQAGAAEMAEKLMNNGVNSYDCYEETPPRIKNAVKLGMSVEYS